jgi:hypothetical protein
MVKTDVSRKLCAKRTGDFLESDLQILVGSLPGRGMSLLSNVPERRTWTSGNAALRSREIAQPLSASRTDSL